LIHITWRIIVNFYAQLQKDPKGYLEAVQLCEMCVGSAACAVTVLEYCGLTVQDRIGFEMEDFGLLQEPRDVGLTFLMEDYSSGSFGRDMMHLVMFSSGFCVLEVQRSYTNHGYLDIFLGDFVWNDGTFGV
jgi:hypothetical protein